MTNKCYSAASGCVKKQLFAKMTRQQDHDISNVCVMFRLLKIFQFPLSFSISLNLPKEAKLSSSSCFLLLSPPFPLLVNSALYHLPDVSLVPLSPSFLQPISLNYTAVLSAPCRRRCLPSAPCTPRIPVSMEISTLTCDSTTGAPLSTWTRPCQNSGPVSWNAPLKAPPPQM